MHRVSIYSVDCASWLYALTDEVGIADLRQMWIICDHRCGFSFSEYISGFIAT